MTNEQHIHVIIGDTQVKPDSPTDHLRWIGQYFAEKYANKPNVTLMQLGDWYDMQSLSWYDRGKKAAEGTRVAEDVLAGNEADEMFMGYAYENGYHDTGRAVKLRGNHEDRVLKHYETYPWLDGALPAFSDVERWDEVVPFLEVVHLDGVAYSHYFYNPNTGRPYSGQSMDARLKTVGRAFTMGHQQGLLIGTRSVLGRAQWGLVLGSTYLHDEVYKGPQGNADFRGIVVAHNVHEGAYDPKIVSLDSLCRRYEGKPLEAYMKGLT